MDSLQWSTESWCSELFNQNLMLMLMSMLMLILLSSDNLPEHIRTRRGWHDKEGKGEGAGG